MAHEAPQRAPRRAAAAARGIALLAAGRRRAVLGYAGPACLRCHRPCASLPAQSDPVHAVTVPTCVIRRFAGEVGCVPAPHPAAPSACGFKSKPNAKGPIGSPNRPSPAIGSASRAWCSDSSDVFIWSRQHAGFRRRWHACLWRRSRREHPVAVWRRQHTVVVWRRQHALAVWRGQ